MLQNLELKLKMGKITNFSIHDIDDADRQLKGHVEPPFAIRRYLNYGRNRGFSPNVLSDATRHHLYDNVLYHNGGDYKIDSYRENEVATSRQSTLKI